MATATKNSTSSKKSQNNKAKSAQSKDTKPKSNQNNNKSKQPVIKPKAAGPHYSNLIRNVTVVLALLGIGVSVFALYVEVMKEKNPNYVAICDISSYISCSKVLTSRYAKGFGIVEQIFSKDHVLNQPNPVYGIAFYLLQALLALKAASAIAVVQAATAILANFGSVYLGYILIYVLEDFCLVCITTYVINFLLLVAGLTKVWQVTMGSSSSSSKTSSKKKKK